MGGCAVAESLPGSQLCWAEEETHLRGPGGEQPASQGWAVKSCPSPAVLGKGISLGVKGQREEERGLSWHEREAVNCGKGLFLWECFAVSCARTAVF